MRRSFLMAFGAIASIVLLSGYLLADHSSASLPLSAAETSRLGVALMSGAIVSGFFLIAQIIIEEHRAIERAASLDRQARSMEANRIATQIMLTDSIRGLAIPGSCIESVVFSNKTVIDLDAQDSEIGLLQIRECATEALGFRGSKLQTVSIHQSQSSLLDLKEAQVGSLTIAFSSFDDANFVLIEPASLAVAESTFIDCNFGSADLRGSDLSYNSFTGSTFTDASLFGANLSGSRFLRCDFRGADLRQATLRDSNFECCEFDAMTKGSPGNDA